jgi:hypothetical protein
MTQPEDVGLLPSPSSALLQLARLKAGLSQRELAAHHQVRPMNCSHRLLPS